jgi:hypothetical protein
VPPLKLLYVMYIDIYIYIYIYYILLNLSSGPKQGIETLSNKYISVDMYIHAGRILFERNANYLQTAARLLQLNTERLGRSMIASDTI